MHIKVVCVVWNIGWLICDRIVGDVAVSIGQFVVWRTTLFLRRPSTSRSIFYLRSRSIENTAVVQHTRLVERHSLWRVPKGNVPAMSILTKLLQVLWVLLILWLQIVDGITIIIGKLRWFCPFVLIILLLRFLVLLSPGTWLNGLLDILLVLFDEVLALVLHILNNLTVHFLDLLQMLPSLRNAVVHWVLRL